MTIAIAFALGYVMGSQAGPEGLAEVKAAFQEITASDQFKELLASGTSIVGEVLKTGVGAIGATMQGGGEGRRLKAV